MTDPHPGAPSSESEYRSQAELLGAAEEHADRVLRQALRDTDRASGDNPYRLAHLQLVADLNRNPK